MLEIHLKQPGFTYSACEPFKKIKREYKSLKNWRFKIYLQK